VTSRSPHHQAGTADQDRAGDAHDGAVERPARVFIVRVWQEGHAGERVWRASVRDAGSAERTYFAHVDTLMEHVLQLAIRT